MKDHGKNNKDRFKINEDALNFSRMSFDEAKHESKRYRKGKDDAIDVFGYCDKDERRDAWAEYLFGLLPETINFVVRYGHMQEPEVKNVVNGVYERFYDCPKLLKLIKRELKDDNEIENIKLFPIMAATYVSMVKDRNNKVLADNQNAETIDLSDIVKIVKMILKKRIDKLEKIGIETGMSMDLLCIIPCNQAMKIGTTFRLKSFFDALYEYAKEVKVPFEDLIDAMFDEEWIPLIIKFALLERKEKFSKLTDNQKNLYLDISNYCFNMMENKLDEDQLEAILKSYADARRIDDSKGRDTNRRYALNSLSENEYPRITSVIKKMTVNNDSIEKYFN